MPTNYADLDHSSIRSAVANHTYSKPGLAIHGTNTENALTASAIIASIAGVMYTKAAVTEIDLSALAVIDETGATATLAAQATAKDRIYLLVMNASAALKIVQGTPVATAAVCPCPRCPDGYVAVGAIKVVNATGSNFTLGTTDLDASNVTATFYDLAMAPEAL